MEIKRIFFLFAFFVHATFATMSGIYVDNGQGKTVLHDGLTPEDQLEVEHEILDLLGLPNRPKRRHAPSLKKSALKFLLDINEKLEEENNLRPRKARSVEDEDENYLSLEDKRAIDESDIISTFLTKNHHTSEVRHEHGRRLWFDISGVSMEYNLVMAELRIFKNPVMMSNATQNFEISVYSIREFGGEEDLELQSTVDTTNNYHGWLEMKITSTLDRWILHRDQNRGIYISIRSGERELRFDETGLVSSRSDEEHQPFIVGFFKGQQMIHPHKIHRSSASRVKRNAQYKRKAGKAEYQNVLTSAAAAAKDAESESCAMKTMYVSFKELKWQDWIVAPDGYGAYYCKGSCNFPLNAHMNATNHAIVQTLVHLMNPGRIPKPCCAPTRLTSISVLYYLADNNVNLKKYKNMVVKSCGCH